MVNDPSKTAAYLAGVIDKLVKNQGRETVRRNAVADPHARWARIPDGNACDFCVMLGSRGFVYHSEESAGGDDPYHPMCNCQIAVSFDPYIDKYQVGMTTVTRGYADDAMLAVPGRDGADELREVDIDELFAQYKAAGKGYNKRSVYKDYTLMPECMADPIAYLESSATEEELRRRADEVLAAYKEHFSAKQLEKYLPSARAAAQRRLEELRGESGGLRQYAALRMRDAVVRADAIPELTVGFDSAQMGRKIGKHARDFGLDPARLEDRELMRTIVDGIIMWPDEVVLGEWMDQPNPCKFYIREEDVVVVNANDEFVTVLKEGAERNTRVKRARHMVQ